MVFTSAQEVLDAVLKNEKLRKQDRKLIVEWLREEKLNPANPVSLKRLEKVRNMIESTTMWFDVPATEITEKEYRKVLENLRDNKLKGKHLHQRSMNYAEETKKDYVAMHKSFLRWIWWKGLNKRIKINGRIATFDQVFRNYKYIITKEAKQNKPEPPIYTKEEIRRIANELPMKYALLLYIGFDTGARPKELMGIRFKDITWDNDKKKYWVFIANPKLSSVKRNVDCAVFNNEISECLANLKLNPDDKIMAVTSVYITKVVRNACSKVGVKKNEQFKLYDLRHSSIQYYTEVYNGNIPTLAIRYGWTIQSAPRRLQGYLARSRIALPDASLMANKDRIREIEEKNKELEKKYEIVYNQLKSAQKMENIQRKNRELELLESLLDMIEGGKTGTKRAKELKKRLKEMIPA